MKINNHRKMRVLDLFCGAGGAAMGLYRAGLKVTGVDISPQPNYPFEFIEADALEIDLDGYDVYWASPPCQCYCWSTSHLRKEGKTYPALIAPIRNRLIETHKPYVIENVVGAPLISPIFLEGMMFRLGVIRRRLFESNILIPQPKRVPKKGSVKTREYCSVAGNGGDGSNRVKDWEKAMQIDWMTKKELTQAVPPAYAEYIGRYFMNSNIKNAKNEK